jgi:peptidase M28-like protein
MLSSRSVVALAFLATAYSVLPWRTPPTQATAFLHRADVCDSAQTQTAAGPSTGNVTPIDVCHLLSALADDSMEGRGTGTVGGARAARFIAEQMRTAGLEPAGDSGFFQRVPLAYATRTGPDGRVQRRAIAVASFADRDTFPADRRGLAVNVIGILTGSDPVLKDSVVLVDAHYDHLGLRAQGPAKADSARMDSIYNGADDDASGTVAVLEIAKQLAAGPRPKRTIVFAATTGEEVGLIGTRWYIAHPARPLASMEANLEIEMIGRPDSLAGGEGRAWLTGFERSTMGATFAAAGLPVVPDKRPDQQFFQRSDNIAFARMGIPAHTLSSYNMHTDYHQVTDEVGAVDFAHMAGVINSAVKAVGILANDKAPAWNAGGKPEAPAPRKPHVSAP